MDGHFHLFALSRGSLCRRLFHGLRGGSFFCCRGGGSFLHRGLLLCLGLLGHGSRSSFFFHHGCRGNGVCLLHGHADLGGGQLQAQKARLLGHFQHFIAHVDIVGLHAQLGAGVGAGFVNRLAGCFLSTDHNTVSPPFCFPARSAGPCARPCTFPRPAGGHTPGGACSSHWRRHSFPRPHRSFRP